MSNALGHRCRRRSDPGARSRGRACGRRGRKHDVERDGRFDRTDSCSACDIRGDKDWSARALQKGITATFGAVNEPYVAGMPEYDHFFLYLTQGASYAEAAYEATRIGASMVVWVGDPLYRPYAKR